VPAADHLPKYSLSPLQGIYLGFDHLRPFPSQQLYTLWTDYNSTNAAFYSDVTNKLSRYSSSVWQLGNDFITAGRCVLSR
jgi:hypothetical protein